MEKIFEKLLAMKPSDTKLDGQILFMEILLGFVGSPMIISIIHSLKELRGIKQNQLKKLKNQNPKR